jgi:hypothetical protein
MNIKDLITKLKKARGYKTAEIEFYLDDEEIFLDSMGQFSFGNDVVIHFSKTPKIRDEEAELIGKALKKATKRYNKRIQKEKFSRK